MDFLLDALTDWLKEMLVGGIMSNLSGMFDSVNQQVADIATQVGQTPQGWNGSIFNMIQNLSNSIMVPIAGVILAIVMTLELIQMITDRNNLHDVDTWMIFKWVFKSAAAIIIVSNTWDIVMGVFDAAQSVVAQAAGIIGSDASIDISSVLTDMESRLMDMDLGPLFGLWFQSLFIGITMWALYICIFIVIYGRMIEIYLTPTLGMTQKNQPKIRYTLDFDVTPHQLRHTYITNLLYGGVDPKTVQYLAGHENSKTTMDIYAKVKYNKPEELFGVVNGAFHQAPAQ